MSDAAPTHPNSSFRRRVLVDGGLATVGLLAIVAVALARGASLDPLAAAAGGAGAVLLEATLASRAEMVRELWEQGGVKVGAVAGLLALIGLSAVFAPSMGLSALAGGLFIYLVLLVTYVLSRVVLARRQVG